ncbi:tetratricopeptide repeat protein [Winogradskyella thalassocola]|uniref:Tetratricopeptide repeat-containing protein n=1 Tax=Winogradskyella thalassocola TaxID=262004 RepID=A0A1G8B5H3_9FLAO|nr:tetratricopeptide repeat protein [Winogradskyella thalassocola]SDH28437.1 Tetratricopeptide repeat-containing protein [Winogradskyella thalassocola]
MKSTILFFVAFLGFYAVKAQTYKNGFRADVCACLEEESLKRTLTENAFKACLRETLPKYAAQIDAEIVESDVNLKFQKGQLARKGLLVAMQYELIYSCDVYFKHLDYQRTSKKLIARENAKETDLEKYNQMVALTPTKMAYYMRGQLQFNLGNIKAAEADVNKSLEINPFRENVKSTRHELLLLAWVYEEQEKYSAAVELYDKIYMGDYDVEVARFRALADRKGGGTVFNSPKVEQIEQIELIKDNKRATRRRAAESNKSSNEIEKKSRTTTRSNAVKVEKKKDTASLRKLLKIDR